MIEPGAVFEIPADLAEPPLVEYAGRHDVLVIRPDGGVQRDSIAQVDLLFTLLKQDLTTDRYRGTLMSDTLRQIRAKLADTLGVAGSEDPG